MGKGLVAKASITIGAPIAKVWEALTKPGIIKRYMFGTDVVTDWQIGNPIVWRGKWEGKSYEDKGRILRLEEEKVLQYSHFSPLSGKADLPENYHIVTIELRSSGANTTVALSQDNNAAEEVREHSEKNWNTMLDGLKKLLEE